MTKNYLKKYQKKKRFLNLSIIAASLVFAVWINIFIFEESDFWKNLKANIIESKVNSQIADIYIKEENKEISITASKTMNDVKNISFSITYNPENIEIFEQNENVKISELPWVHTYLITFEEPKNINKWDTILSFIAHKNNEKNESINVIGANFTDQQWKEFALSTSWINF